MKSINSPLQRFLAQALKDFKTYLELQGHQRSTIDHRLRGAEQFALFLLGTSPQKGDQNKGGLAGETGGNIMEILHIIMKESIKEDNETKRMKLQELDDLNTISKAYGQSLSSLADSSSKLASRENKAGSDAKVRVRYDLYDTSTVGPDGQPIKTGTISKNVSRNGLNTEMKRLENRMEELRNRKQKTTNEFQHLDQIVNQTMQGIARILRALGQMRTGAGIAKPGM